MVGRHTGAMDECRGEVGALSEQGRSQDPLFKIGSVRWGELIARPVIQEIVFGEADLMIEVVVE
jgi:hypothetical protein